MGAEARKTTTSTQISARRSRGEVADKSRSNRANKKCKLHKKTNDLYVNQSNTKNESECNQIAIINEKTKCE